MQKELDKLFTEKGKLVTELEILQNKLNQINQLISNIMSVETKEHLKND